jgi:Arc/MetJ-type ribon-helix-helix transcriptional regulator
MAHEQMACAVKHQATLLHGRRCALNLNEPLHDRTSSPSTIQPDGAWMGTMASRVVDFRPKADSEKITINLGYVDLGHIDLMVQEGFYSNRTDFIRTAIRNQLDRQNDAVRQSLEKHSLDLGLCQYTRKDLEAARAARKKLHINALGLVVIAADVSPELARETIASIRVLGGIHATSQVKAALADRMP